MGQRIALVVFIAGTALGLGSCQRGGQLLADIHDLQHVQRQLSEQAGTRDVSVNLNIGRFLYIGITNASWAQLPTAERRQKALEIARAAYAGFPSRSRLEVVTVSFRVHRTYFLFINYFKDTDVFQFATDDFAPRAAAAASSEGWVLETMPQSQLYFVAIGDVPPAWLHDMAAHFEEKFGLSITVLAGLMFDRVTFDRHRSQTVADELILAIRRRYPRLARDDRARVIGVTPYDMYMQEMAAQWAFVFSLRSHDQHFAVVSYARMDPARLRKEPDAGRLETRLRKMVAKNIGLMYYGLPVSQDPRSVLYGNVGGVDELDLMTEYFEPKGGVLPER
jgi:predicted Zn-dependent protease